MGPARCAPLIGCVKLQVVGPVIFHGMIEVPFKDNEIKICGGEDNEMASW